MTKTKSLKETFYENIKELAKKENTKKRKNHVFCVGYETYKKIIKD